MKTIHKYQLPITGKVTAPEGAKFLTVQTQDGGPQLWALVDTLRPMVEHDFRVFGTGHPYDGEDRYIGTFQLNDGALVFHVFQAVTA